MLDVIVAVFALQYVAHFVLDKSSVKCFCFFFYRCCDLMMCYFMESYVVSDPKQRLAMFRKLEEMSRVRPVALHPRKRRHEYSRGKKLSI